ncbi:hypothetical protein MNO14_06235 [Luteimonas sp. S4-F44]|uniref:hypothetical protein n=1 Tax=Luteimonas sp. S4-F44 TaxID=2925842 RepID=UPI001F52FC46|nr:hypothetical protein [Luteimonas sp. S4-F44]UNK43664.1 hypothetical protein MNO14_06235 [Luteimonas sp. S4-F44]
MDKVKARKDQGTRCNPAVDARSSLDRLIGQMQKQAPKGTALDNAGIAPQSTCFRTIYCF